mmetsp:Transcript_25820/g.53702  ORF Transcript_25820/g.53702 Transcript_25820/m.53702 type:complete len:230 (+) Transcript_25820:157-846(+)
MPPSSRQRIAASLPMDSRNSTNLSCLDFDFGSVSSKTVSLDLTNASFTDLSVALVSSPDSSSMSRYSPRLMVLASPGLSSLPENFLKTLRSSCFWSLYILSARLLYKNFSRKSTSVSRSAPFSIFLSLSILTASPSMALFSSFPLGLNLMYLEAATWQMASRNSWRLRVFLPVAQADTKIKSASTRLKTLLFTAAAAAAPSPSPPSSITLISDMNWFQALTPRLQTSVV